MSRPLPLSIERIADILARHVPTGGRVVGLGSDLAPYADWFARRGCPIDMLEPSRPDRSARTRPDSADSGMDDLGSGDSFPDASADAVIIVGPLYCLPRRVDRERLLRRAFGILRPGGLVAATALGRLASVNAAIATNTARSPADVEALMSTVATGTLASGELRLHAHRPDELASELRAAGFEHPEVCGVEGIVNLLPQVVRRSAAPHDRAALLDFLATIENDPVLVEISANLVVIARRGIGDCPHVVAPADQTAASMTSGRAVAARSKTAAAADATMARYYAAGAEADRLETRHLFEFERTKAILSDRLPARGRVLDIGGGPGVYAGWLASRGYDVELIDPIPLHISQARRRAQSGMPFNARLGDARSLPFEAAYADAIVMLGPLFHLVDRADRRLALSESYRVLSPGGTVVVSAMGRSYPLYQGIVSHGFVSAAEREQLAATVATGLRFDPLRPFPAYAHRPDELDCELRDAGYVDVEIVAIEGYVQLLEDVAPRLEDPLSHAILLDLLHRLEADPAMVAASGHIMAVARRPSAEELGSE